MESSEQKQRKKCEKYKVSDDEKRITGLMAIAAAMAITGCTVQNGHQVTQTSGSQESSEASEYEGVDAVSSASVVQPGNVAQMAGWIQEEIGGDLLPCV